MWGLAGAELALLPAFVAALTTDGVLGLRHSDTDFWIVTTVYVVITIYVIARLFPWREVQALTSEPDAKPTRHHDGAHGQEPSAGEAP